MNPALNQIKAFGMTNQMLLEDMTRIGKLFGVELGHLPTAIAQIEDVYYPQFEATIRKEAARMRLHYEMFYCLEQSIRALVSETLEAALGEDWWNSGKIPPNVKSEVEGRLQREIDAGVSQRSSEELDYTNFGELSVIITANFDLFASIFSGNKKKAVERVLANLNTLRAPIAHCSPLAKDEVVRFELLVSDWFRLME
jgi:hypothetical protein